MGLHRKFSVVVIFKYWPMPFAPSWCKKCGKHFREMTHCFHIYLWFGFRLRRHWYTTPWCYSPWLWIAWTNHRLAHAQIVEIILSKQFKARLGKWEHLLSGEGEAGICYLGDKPHSPNLSDLAECVILCTSWLPSPGKVYCRMVNIWVTLVQLRGPILSVQAGHQLSTYCIKELFGRNSPHLASVNSGYKI